MRRQQCCGYCENCTTVGLRLARLGSKEENSPGETRCKKSWGWFEKYDSLSLRYVEQLSRKREDYRLEKYKSNLNISEVPTLWNLRTGPMKRLKDDSDAPVARRGILPKISLQAQRARQNYIPLARGRMGTRLRQQKSRRKESLLWFPERVCTWSATEILTQKKRMRRQQCCRECENCTNALVCQRGKQSRRNPMQKVLGSIRMVRFTQSTPRQASIREKKGPSLGTLQVQTSTSAKSLHYEIWGQISGRDWKKTAMRPKQGLEPWQKQIKAQRERHEDIERSDDGDDGQRQGANNRRSYGICHRIGPIRDGYASWRNSRSSCENCTTIGLRRAGLGCVGFSQWWNPMQKVFGTHSTSTIHTVYATSSKYPTLRCLPSRKTPQAKVRGVWSYSCVFRRFIPRGHIEQWMSFVASAPSVLFFLRPAGD